MTYPFMNKEIAQALYEALTQDPFYITMEQKASRDAAAAKDAMLKYMDYSMKEALAHGELVIPKNQSYGASIWSKPVDNAHAKKISQEKKQFLKDHLGESLDTYSRIVNYMSEAAGNVVSGTFWYLSILGVAPDLQGKGLGLGLVLPILEKIDTLGVGAYIETFTPKNFGFYKRLGFYEARTVHEPVTNADYTIMIRDARYSRKAERRATHGGSV